MRSREAGHADVRVLVVDDEQLLSKALARALAAEGYAVELAFDVDEAMTRLKGGPFLAVLTDLHLGVKAPEGGARILTACQERQPQAMRILMTGNPLADIGARTLAHAFLAKPFLLADLSDTLRVAWPTAEVRHEDAVRRRPRAAGC